MEVDDGSNDVVHPEVRAHISSLVSALGGYSAEDDGAYKLGDDALEVLRDLKKWIRFYDEKTNRMDVARCLAEANLVGGDLLQILAQWTENDANGSAASAATSGGGGGNARYKARVALACFEIMVPLTWPMERDADKTTVNHYRHMPTLQLAQLAYKRAIINFDGARVLHAAVRAALPSMAVPIAERSARDGAIIKLALFFLRNVAMIAPPPGVSYDGDESQISRSATIDAFSYQDIFLTVLAVASNMGEDFRTEDVVLMEIVFHLVKRVKVEDLFMSERQLSRAKEGELGAMMSKEASMLRAHNRRAPTRHNRFGTMIWVERDGGRVSALSGQQALVDPSSRIAKLDGAKKFKPPRRANKAAARPKDLGPPVSLNARANEQLRGFVEDFLDAGFNPLFVHVRKSIDREAPHVLPEHKRQFFYLVAWFLEAERVRRKYRASSGSKAPASAEEIGSFNLVAGVLNQEMFISLNRAMARAFDEKDWDELSSAMRCFTQILLTVQEMTDSANEDNEEIAENMLNRLFYEEATHDLVANIAKSYKDQGFEYLDAATDLVHTFLRLLEAYSKQNVDMQVRSRKRTRRKKKKAERAARTQASGGGADKEGEAGEAEGRVEEGEEDGGEDGSDDEDGADAREAERTSRERRFDFVRFTNRFAQQSVVDTFVALARFYRDLDAAQLKRAHRFFYRVAFKQDMSVVLFRVDVVHLLHAMIKGPEPLDRASPMFKEWEELARQVLKRCFRKLEERPALAVEMLFSKLPSTVFYLEYGHEKQTLQTSQPKPGAELEFKQIAERDRQIAILVGVLLDRNLQDHLAWLKGVAAAAESERRAWEQADRAIASVESQDAAEGGEVVAPEQNAAPTPPPPPIAVKPDTAERRTAMFKNSYLRLLMQTLGFERVAAPPLEETPESGWVVPPATSADFLRDGLDHLRRAEFAPPAFDEGELAEDQLRRRPNPNKPKPPPRQKKRGMFDGEEEEEGRGLNGFLDDDEGEEDFLFPDGGPTTRKPADALLDLAKKRRQRKRKERDVDAEGGGASSDDEDEAARRARALARRRKEVERRRRIKSALYVDAADDGTDDERDAEFYRREEEIRRRARRIAETVPADEAQGAAAPTDGLDDDMRRRVLERKRRLMAGSDDDDEDGVEDVDAIEHSQDRRSTTDRPPAKTGRPPLSSDGEGSSAPTSDDDDDDDDGDGGGEDHHTDDTPLSSSPQQQQQQQQQQQGARLKKRRRLSPDEDDDELAQIDADGDVHMRIESTAKAKSAAVAVDDDDDDDDVVASSAPVRRQRARVSAGFILDSDDDE